MEKGKRRKRTKQGEGQNKEKDITRRRTKEGKGQNKEKDKVKSDTLIFSIIFYSIVKITRDRFHLSHPLLAAIFESPLFFSGRLANQ